MVGTGSVRTVKVLKMWHFKDLDISIKVNKDKEEPNTNNRQMSQNFIIVKRCSPNEVKHSEENMSDFIVREVVEVKMDLCRICLQQGTIPIHGDNPSEDMADAISTFGGIAISIFDSCPKFLCESCYGLLQGAIMFRKTAQCSNRLLKKYSATDDIDDEVCDVSLSAQTDLGTYLDKPMEPSLETDNHFSSSSLDIGAEVSILEPQVCLKTAQDMSNIFIKPNSLDSTTNANISKSPADVDEAPSLFEKKFNLTCQQCDVQFANFCEYRDHKLHMRSHKKKMCTVCKQTYALQYIKKYNESLQKMEHMYVCDTCYGNNKDKACNEPETNNFSNDFSDLAVEHVNKAIVKQNVLLTCKECNIKFDKLQDYRKHRLQTRKHMQKMCTVCNSTYAKRYITKNSSSTKGVYVCNDCYKKDTNNVDQEPVNDNSNKTPSSFVVRQLKLKCRQCNLLFNAHHEYTLHKNLHEQKTKTCPICNKSYSKRYHKIHMQIHKAGGADYMCDICGKHFAQYSSFKCHRAIHFNNLPYACSLCPYRTLSNNSLIIHMRSHTGERPYLCEECPQKFVTKSNLIKHRYTHKKERDFKCECGKEFHTKRDLDAHVKVEHAGIREHICQICGKAYGYRKVLLRHQLRVHKRGKLRGGKQPSYLKVQSMKNQENDIATA